MKRKLLLVGLLTTFSVCFISLGYAQTEISLPSEESPVINPPVGITLPNDTYFYLQWSHHNTGNVPVFPGANMTTVCGLPGFDMNIPQAWEYMNNKNLSQIRVGILDSGLDPNIDPNTSDLDTARLLPGMNFSNASPNSNTADTLGHGTHVLGAIAATVNNGRGIAGVDRNCLVMPLKMNPAGTREQRTRIADAIHYGINHGVKVFNISWGWNEITIDNDIREAISYGIANGCTFVGAAGNDYHATVDFPAKVVIAVGAANPCGAIKSPASSLSCEQDLRSETPGGPVWGTNYGAGLDLMGPGTMLPAVDISGASGLSGSINCNLGSCYISAENGNYVRNAFGTSIAAPYVTGIVSQMLAINNQLTMHEIEYLLMKASVTPMTGGDYRLPDAYEAMVLASEYTPGTHPVTDLAVDQVVYERINDSIVKGTITVSNRSASVASAATQLYVYTSHTKMNSSQDIAGQKGHKTVSIPSIPANTTQTYQVIIPYDPHPGDTNTTVYRLWLNAVVDPNMLLEETDKANNAKSIMVNYNQIILPDLLPYQASYTSSGNSVQLTYKVRNSGEKNAVFPSGSVVAKFWASNNSTLGNDDLLIGSQTITGSLTIAYLQAPEFSKSLTLNRNYLIIQVNPNNSVIEEYYSNNNLAVEIATTPSGVPDLHPNNVTYSVNVNSLGKAVNMSYYIKNSGNADGKLYLYNDAVKYWDSDDNALTSDDLELGAENMNGVFTIPPGQSMLFPNKNKLAVRSFLLIQVIPDILNGESNVANNVYAIPLIQTSGSDEEQTDPSGQQLQTPGPKPLKEEAYNNTNSPVIKTDLGNLNDESLLMQTGRLEQIKLSDESQLELFPNPAREQVTLLIEMDNSGQISIIDLLGNHLHELLLNESGKQKIVLDTSHLSPGTYFVELRQTSGKSILKKLIIH